MSKRVSGPLSPKEIEERFEEAARTLRRLPEDKRARFLKDLGRLIAVTPVAPAAEPAGKSGGKTKKKSKKSKKSGA